MEAHQGNEKSIALTLSKRRYRLELEPSLSWHHKIIMSFSAYRGQGGCLEKIYEAKRLDVEAVDLSNSDRQANYRKVLSKGLMK